MASSHPTGFISAFTKPALVPGFFFARLPRSWQATMLGHITCRSVPMPARRISVLALALFAGSAWAADCREAATPLAADMFVAAPEMRRPLTMPGLGCTLAQDVIARARLDAAAAATGLQASTPGGPAVTAAQAYVPKTKDDNTPWRFDMNQNGRRMTAEEFDAWMKAKGIHVATGRPASAAASAEPTASASGASTP